MPRHPSRRIDASHQKGRTGRSGRFHRFELSKIFQAASARRSVRSQGSSAKRTGFQLGSSTSACDPTPHREAAGGQVRADPSPAGKTFVAAIDRSTAGATSGATRTGAPRFRTEHGDKGLLFRSRKQHAASTCKLSRAGRDFRVRVQGCAWSSVAVDVGIDVGQEVLRSRAMVGCVPARQTSDAWSGA